MKQPALRALIVSLLVLGATATLSACGWHLRGAGAGAVSLEGQRLRLTAQMGEGDLTRAVRNALQTAGAKLVSDPKAKVPELILLSENVGRRAKTITTSKEVSEYEVIEQVAFRVLDSEGNPLIDQRTVRRTGVYSSQATQVQVSESRRRQVTQDLRADVVNQILAQMQIALGQGQ